MIVFTDKATMLGISYGSVQTIIANQLGYYMYNSDCVITTIARNLQELIVKMR